ncbi:hypothetical protein K458DRAFT_16602 [Lentithecium fluviatile CBS 122367]|uniref:Uncharacterized protein n=1 Tax=Lentithecium fluviatile CBS 122367 TaxID=1168545 RepID=A0A6G1J662_9PLEO|nr:hypothetical protein K458DRAFT_16602 [Lentithecium fluviatile CBS 122367]
MNNTMHGLSGGKDKVKVLVVQLLSRNSEMVFYKRSHLYPLGAKPATIRLLNVPRKSLEKDDIKSFHVKAKEGGLAIIDGRLGFAMLNRVTVMARFAVEEELKH